MRRYRASDGSLRIWFDPEEIEDLAEDQLQRAGLAPTLASPVVDVERFVEEYLQAELDQYAPLDADVLGVTEFRPGQPPLVCINRMLTEAAFEQPNPSPAARGRWRATLAHEAGHILLHRSLVEPNPAQTTFLELPEDEVQTPTMGMFRCVQREVVFGGGADWREVQANRCMAALLMPRSIFLRVVAQVKQGMGLSPREPLRADRLNTVVRKLARHFQVSRQAARIRLEELGLVTAPWQRDLYFDRSP